MSQLNAFNSPPFMSFIFSENLTSRYKYPLSMLRRFEVRAANRHVNNTSHYDLLCCQRHLSIDTFSALLVTMKKKERLER